MFTMQKNNNAWNFYGDPVLPDWILDHEASLSNLIEEELKVMD
jgi:hypothetical protein